MSALLIETNPLLVCLTPGPLPSALPYRIGRAGNPAGVGLSLTKPESLQRWIQDTAERRVIVRFDGEAFLLWDYTHRDLAKIEANWVVLISLWGLPMPPERAGGVSPEETWAGCHHAWRVTRYLKTHKSSSAEEEEKDQAQENFFSPTPPPLTLPEDAPLCFVDVETTGGSPANGARVVQLALTRLDQVTGEAESFSSLVNPEGRESEYGAWKTHQLSKWTLAKAPYFRRLLPRVLPLLDGAVFVAHNACVCDEPYMRSELSRVQAEWPCLGVIDTLRVARKLYAFMNAGKKKEQRQSFALGSLASLLVVEQGLKHDAKGDVHTLMGVWHAMRQQNPKTTLSEMVRM